MYRIQFTKEAQKQIEKLPKKVILKIFEKIEKLASDPKPPGSKSLKGKLAHYYRIRSGDYRVIYAVEDDKLVILVVKVAHRKDIYDF
jgi:mRNA interferase RelE/StbE